MIGAVVAAVVGILVTGAATAISRRVRKRKEREARGAREMATDAMQEQMRAERETLRDRKRAHDERDDGEEG